MANMNNAASAEKDAPDSCETIMQYWDTNIPDYVQELVDSVTSQSDGVEHQFFDDESARELLQYEFGTEVVGLYDNCAIPAMKSDLFRYCYLFKFGGLYMDTDYRCIKSLRGLMELAPRGILYKRRAQTNNTIGIVNSLIYFRYREDPLAEQFVEKMLFNVRNRVSSNVWAVTGPAVMRSVLEEQEDEALVEGMLTVEEDVISMYLESPTGLAYKNTNAHWFEARANGISIFKN